jgi:hypothetical protein
MASPKVSPGNVIYFNRFRMLARTPTSAARRGLRLSAGKCGCKKNDRHFAGH